MNNLLTIASKPDLSQAGQDIYDALTSASKRGWKNRARKKPVTFDTERYYAPAEVAALVSISYDAAIRLMKRTGKTIDLSAPRTRKRMLRIRGKHLREYLDGKQT
jgi:hypothetical protein